MSEKPRILDDESGSASAGMGAPSNHPRERRDKVLNFAGFVFDGPRRLLTRDGTEVLLRPQTFDVLRALVHSANEVVSKDTLFADVWRGVTVTDDSLVQCIHELRAALGDSEQHLIRTVPRRGYMLTAEVVEDRSPRRSDQAQAVRRRRAVLVTAAAAVAAALALAGSWHLFRPPRPTARAGALAVLPFRPLTAPSEEDEMLGLGIADALILKLSAVTRLTVRPTSAILRLRPEDGALASGRRLGADYVLEGHFQRSGNALRVTVQLLDVGSETSLWSDHLEANASDLFRVQDAIAARASASLLEAVSREEGRLIARRDTAIPEARLAYVRGRYLWSRRTESALEASLVQFRRALELDPHYALAASGMADAHNLLGAYGSRLPRESFERAIAASRRALELDDTLAEAHASLAFALAHHDYDWEGSQREYRRALELAPGYATGLQWLALCLVAQGRFEEAIATSRRAMQADPLSPIIATDLGRHLYYARRYDESIEQLRSAVELDPTFARAHQELGRAYRQRGFNDLAVSELSRAVALSDRASGPLSELAAASAAAGDVAGALEILDELSRRARAGTYVSGYHFAVISAALGERDRAVAELRSAYQDRFNWIVFAAVEPEFDALRAAPGFREIVARMGL